MFKSIWLNPVTKTSYETDEHTDFVLENPHLFGIDDVSQYQTANKVIRDVLDNGWIRVVTSRNELGLQGKNTRLIHRAAKMLLKKFPEVNSLVIDISKEETPTFSFKPHSNLTLRGDRLEYFLRKGRIPGKMVHEAEETQMKKAVFTFGRFNPPTIGHQALITKVIEVAEKNDANYFVMPSKTTDKKKNPLSFDDKVAFMHEMFPGVNIETDADIINPFSAVKWLENKGYQDIIMVAGSDRVDQFQDAISAYIGHPDPDKGFNIDSFHVVSAGDRDPDSEGVTGASASKARTLALNGDFDEFAEIVPLTDREKVHSLFTKIRAGLGVKESITDVQLIRKILNIITEDD